MATTAGHAPSRQQRDSKTLAPLRLGPVTRSKTAIDSLVPPSNYQAQLGTGYAPPSSQTGNYPRIIVKDPFGRTLDTFTTLQEAIYRASWTRKKMKEWPKTPLEWRLPKAPTPSKPDYSRAGPAKVLTSLNLDPGSHHRKLLSQSHDVSLGQERLDFTADVLVNVQTREIPVDDVAFVAESLNQLPNLPSFSFLRHAILAGQSTYVQIVASILLHQKQLRGTDQRTADWEFPGFCSGCKRAGFCYGCNKNPKPHVHEDISARTGGGFRFWKRDRPSGSHDWKHPGNWKLPSTEKELRNMIEKYGGLAAYEQAVLKARREMVTEKYDLLDNSTVHSSRYQRLKNLGTYPPYVTIIGLDDFDEENDEDNVDIAMGKSEGQFDDEDLEDDGEEYSREGGNEDYEEESIEKKEWTVGVKSEEEDMDLIERTSQLGMATVAQRSRSITSKSTSHGSDYSQDRSLVRIDTGFEEMSEDDPLQRKRVSILTQEEEGEEEEEVDEEPKELGRGRHISRVSRTSHTGSDSSSSQNKGSQSRSRKVSRLDFLDQQKMEEEEEQARLRMERAKENVPFGKKRRDVNYQAPRFFTVQKRTRRITVAKDPFTSDRDLNVPRGGTFQLKKNGKGATKFVDFKRGNRGWTAPKKFELKKDDKKTTQFWNGGLANKDGGKKKRRGDGEDEDDEASRRRRHQALSPDSGLDSATTGGKDGRTSGNAGEDDAQPLGDKDGQSADDSGKLGQGVGGTDATGDKESAGGDGEEGKSAKPKRREIVKKTRQEKFPITPPLGPSPTRLPPPPAYKRRSETPPTPTLPRIPTPQKEEPPLPDIDLPEIPDLPEIEDKEPEKRKQKQKFLVEPPPPQPTQQDAPKKRRAAPRVRIIPKHLSRPRRSRPAEAPVTSEDLMDIQDPLDFLAKYCIINPDRLPFYEIIFESTVAEQTPRYTRPAPWEMTKGERDGEIKDGTKDEVEENDGKKKKGKSRKKKSGKEKDRTPSLHPELFPTERGMNIEKAAMTIEEQHLEKLIYTLDLLQDKMMSLGFQLEEFEVKRTRMLASRAKEICPEIASPDYFPKTKKKGKKGKKDKKASEPPRKLRHDEITDDVIVARIDDKMLNELCKEQDLKHLEAEIERLREKIRDVQNRVESIASEKLLADAFCMNHYFMRQGVDNNKPEDFRRQQSELYNRLRPSPDFEMNIEEVEESLQQINNHLLTEKEFAFLYNILNLPGRAKINFRLFSIIAALSEKVTQLDPVIRKLINSFNYNALDIKMEKCKELFDLLETDHMPKGAAQAASLAVELTAGGLKPEHTNYVLNKFNRESKGIIDFLDFVTYVPLFVEIHKRIISDPLKADLDL